LDGRLHMDRVHEVYAHHVARPPRGAGNLRDRDARGIRAEAHVWRSDPVERLVDRPLDLPVLGRVLDDELARRGVLEVGREHHALQGLLPRYPRQRFRQQGGEPDVLQHLGLSALQYLIRNIDRDRRDAVQHQIGDDADADVSRADYAYALEFRVTKHVASLGWFVSVDRAGQPPRPGYPEPPPQVRSAARRAASPWGF